MTTARDYVPERRHATLTPGRSLRILREFQGLTQSELARKTGIAQSAISAFESDTKEMGLKRVKVLAEALGVHPAVIAFPDYDERFAPGPGLLKAAAPRPPLPTLAAASRSTKFKGSPMKHAAAAGRVSASTRAGARLPAPSASKRRK